MEIMISEFSRVVFMVNKILAGKPPALLVQILFRRTGTGVKRQLQRTTQRAQYPLNKE